MIPILELLVLGPVMIINQLLLLLFEFLNPVQVGKKTETRFLFYFCKRENPPRTYPELSFLESLSNLRSICCVCIKLICRLIILITILLGKSGRLRSIRRSRQFQHGDARMAPRRF